MPKPIRGSRLSSRCNHKSDKKEQQHRTRAVGNIAYRFGEPDDGHVGRGILVFIADGFEFLGNRRIRKTLARLRVRVQQVGTDQRALQVVAHQAADQPGFLHIDGNGCQIRGGALERRRDYVAAGEAFLDHFDEPHVGCEQ